MNGSNCRLRSTSVDLDRDGKPAPSVRHGSLPSSAKSKIKDAALTSRRRALSVAAAEPSAETIIIVKAKRAAQYLWTLLHAQVRLSSLRYSKQFCPSPLTTLVDALPRIAFWSEIVHTPAAKKQS